MDTTKIIVWANPTDPFQQIYVFKDGNLVDKMNTTPNYITKIVLDFVNKHQINSVDFAGTRAFCEHFMTSLQEEAIVNYKELNINFVE